MDSNLIDITKDKYGNKNGVLVNTRGNFFFEFEDTYKIMKFVPYVNLLRRKI